MKKILFYALGVLLPVAVCLAVYSYEKPITDPTVMANIEALTNIDNDTFRGARSGSDGPVCYVYVNGLRTEGKESVCYPVATLEFCTNGVCSIKIN